MKSFLDMVERDAIEKGVTNVIYRMLEKKQPPEVISDMTGKPIEYVHSVQKKYIEMVRENAKYGKADQ